MASLAGGGNTSTPPRRGSNQRVQVLNMDNFIDTTNIEGRFEFSQFVRAYGKYLDEQLEVYNAIQWYQVCPLLWDALDAHPVNAICTHRHFTCVRMPLQPAYTPVELCRHGLAAVGTWHMKVLGGGSKKSGATGLRRPRDGRVE